MLKVESLTPESFTPFGTFIDPWNCGGALGPEDGPVVFYPDKILQQFSASNYIALSTLALRPRPMEINVTEMHRFTEELIGGFTKDVVFHVGPAGSENPPVHDYRVFRLPAGWWVRFKRGVWHHAPFVVGDEPTVGMVLLPPYTYTNDTLVVPLQEAIKVQA